MQTLHQCSTNYTKTEKKNETETVQFENLKC